MTAALKVIASVVLGISALATHGFGIASGTAFGHAAGDPGPRTVVITIHHSRFTPAVVDVKGGSTVRFVVRNTDPIDHEFIVGDRAIQDAHERGGETHHNSPGAVSAPAEQRVDTIVTFPSAPATTIFGCHLPDHYAYGMQGLIRIT